MYKKNFRNGKTEETHVYHAIRKKLRHPLHHPGREAVILKICPPTIITSAEVIIAEYDAILGQ